MGWHWWHSLSYTQPSPPLAPGSSLWPLSVWLSYYHVVAYLNHCVFMLSVWLSYYHFVAYLNHCVFMLPLWLSWYHVVTSRCITHVSALLNPEMWILRGQVEVVLTLSNSHRPDHHYQAIEENGGVSYWCELVLWEYIIAKIRDNKSPRFVANIYSWCINNINVDL